MGSTTIHSKAPTMGIPTVGKFLLLQDGYSKEKGITPDGITFTAVLMACTHGGLVKEGKWFFESMEKDHSISPKLQHYGCMVDLLGRAGLLIEAYDLIKRMPMGADAVVWGALLGACSFHGNVEFAEIAAESLFKLEPWNPGNHVILANIYSCAGMWDSVAGVWKKIKIKQQKKVAGCSFVELGGKMHKFLVEDESHPSSKEIYILLDQIYTMMYLTDDDLHSNLQDAWLV
ncbi:hypothetical protein HPP92_028072 [Vanilla planifolia]|uniref:Pentatricopeptide repeat-containing protein n=1 Tax=Vanilla planifolia TaxID=51239 RepID=A0A835P9A0_VANPL|nr:hypothetical protein HPP92_028072 [Vanilla planifolia]KAG0448047.1 hypothetical protein HPP92_028042 [Vanilla planifolia]